jgi:hypothetical protein
VINLSASKVDCFFGCEKLYYFRYIAKPITPPDNKYFLIGNIAHNTLELFYSKGFHKRAESFKENLSSCLKESYLKYNLMGLLKKNVFVKRDVENIQTMMKGYLKNVLPTHLVDVQPNVAFVEKSFYITVDDFKIAGKADRVDFNQGNYTIVDYKTNSKAFSKKEMAESVQLPTYKIWLDTLYKKDYPNYKVNGEYVYLKLTSGKKWKSVFEITDELVEAALERYRFVRQKLNNGCEFKRNMSFKYCGPMCDYFAICKKES